LDEAYRGFFHACRRKPPFDLCFYQER
jgi:hypothetical protein